MQNRSFLYLVFEFSYCSTKSLISYNVPKIAPETAELKTFIGVPTLSITSSYPIET